jgi:hypothetical protein
MHIYHYAPYEPAALKRLMGRYATREEELDRMLRAKLFVDLYQVVRHAIRAGAFGDHRLRVGPRLRRWPFDVPPARPSPGILGHLRLQSKSAAIESGRAGS